MELTTEQLNIINSVGDIKINAVAGSGKTTTMIEYARTRPAGSRILYLAFNKSVKLEAVQKFQQQGLPHVKVETAHSLAFKYIVTGSKYRVLPQAYKTYDIAQILGLQAQGEKHAEYMVASHINKFITYFCNSDKPRVQDLNYLSLVSDPKARKFVTALYPYIESQTRLLLAKMDKGEIEVIHDFYLKKFQLSNPVLPYDYILFDEGQDASPAMLDVFMKQKAVKVIVGDAHQQIYGWRHAVNSLEKADFQILHLTASFRFGQDIAQLASEILWRKHMIRDHSPVSISGKGNNKAVKVKAVLARTNLGLLLKAIEMVREQKKIRKVYFEGNINSYTYAEEGASLYDVLNLYNGETMRIRDKLIREMRGMDELEEYISKTEDVQLGMMVEIVKAYGNDIPRIIKSIKDKHVENNLKEEADMIFSTVHKSKGMEYDTVQLVDDFITEEKLEKYLNEAGEDDMLLSKLNEEINLLYVAVTRTKNSLIIPESLMPDSFPPSACIHVLEDNPMEDIYEIHKPFQPGGGKKKSPVPVVKLLDLDAIRAKHKDAYKPWTEELDEELTVMYCEGVNIKDLARHFGRSRGAIESRILKLELEDLYG